MSRATTEKKRPVQVFRLGRIKAAIWENETQNGTRYNVTFQRIYLDEQAVWQTSTSFGRDDLPLIEKLAARCHAWVFEQVRDERSVHEDHELAPEEEEVPY